MKVGTLACILGVWAGAGVPGRILDIGTGTGVLALMMAQRFKNAVIDAVEIDPEAAAQAKENSERSKWGDRINIYCENIRNYRPKKKLKYDLIISNPPFYKNQTLSADKKENLARHGCELTLNQLADQIVYFLDKSGSFYVILPPGETVYFRAVMKKNKLYPFRELSIYHRPGTPVKAMITAFSFKRCALKKREIRIWDDEGNRDAAYARLMSDFYLDF